jgi:hypothetical protein
MRKMKLRMVVSETISKMENSIASCCGDKLQFCGAFGCNYLRGIVRALKRGLVESSIEPELVYNIKIKRYPDGDFWIEVGKGETVIGVAGDSPTEALRGLLETVANDGWPGGE